MDKTNIKKDQKLRVLVAGDNENQRFSSPQRQNDYKKLKILAAGDIHGDTGLAEKLAERAQKEHCDLVILCGDLTMMDQSTDNIIGPFKKRNEKVLILPGNHETVATADFLAELYGMKNIHGYSVKYNDVGIFGCGGANIGLFQLEEDEIFPGSKGVRKAIDKFHPDLLLCSHVHEAEGIEEKIGKTHVINVGKKGKIIEI